MESKAAGKLYLIPIPIVNEAIHTIPEAVQHVSISLKYYFVEQIRTARRYLKQLDKHVDIDAITFVEINKHSVEDTALLEQWLQAGYDVGVMSESGCPGIADPGSILVAKAQEMGAVVVPNVGPSSILLSLMASGFSGQHFRFLGYLPVKTNERAKAIKQLEEISRQRNETQIFIETPYRNMQMLQDLLKDGHPNTKLCIAANITAPDAFISTKTLAKWKKNMDNFSIPKVPCIFLIAAYH